MEFSLTPSPTFTIDVAIPVPGAPPAVIRCSFRHLSKSEYKTLVAENPPDIDYMMAVLVGWNLDDEFNRENVLTLINNYHDAAATIAKAYLFELTSPAGRAAKVTS